MPDFPDWTRSIARGMTNMAGSPFTVPAGTSVTKTFTPDPTAHAVLVGVSPYVYAAFCEVVGHTTGIIYASWTFGVDIGAVIVPVAVVIDQQVDIRVDAKATGSLSVYCVSLDDIVSMGVYTPIPVTGNAGVLGVTVIQGNPLDLNVTVYNPPGQSLTVSLPTASWHQVAQAIGGSGVHVSQGSIGGAAVHLIEATLSAAWQTGGGNTFEALAYDGSFLTGTLMARQWIGVPGSAGSVGSAQLSGLVAASGLMTIGFGSGAAGFAFDVAGWGY